MIIVDWRSEETISKFWNTNVSRMPWWPKGDIWAFNLFVLLVLYKVFENITYKKAASITEWVRTLSSARQKPMTILHVADRPFQVQQDRTPAWAVAKHTATGLVRNSWAIVLRYHAYQVSHSGPVSLWCLTKQYSNKNDYCQTSFISSIVLSINIQIV